MANDRLISDAENKPRAVWNIVRRVTGKTHFSKTPDVELMYEGKKITNPPDIAKLFNKYFINIFDDLGLSVDSEKVSEFLNYKQSSNQSSIFLTPVTFTEVFNSLTSLKNKPSFGWDEIPSIVLKESAHLLAKPLAFLVNQSLKLANFQIF